MPGVFKDVDHQMKVINDPKLSGELITSLEKTSNFTVLGGFTQGSRHIYADKAVTTPSDLSRTKLSKRAS